MQSLGAHGLLAISDGKQSDDFSDDMFVLDWPRQSSA